MQSKKKVIYVVLLLCLLGSTVCAASETTQPFSVESILVNGSSSGLMPADKLSVSVTVKSHTETENVDVVVAAYSAEGKMLCAEAEAKMFAAQQCTVSDFSFDNREGNIHSFKAFVLSEKDGYIPVSETRSISDVPSAERVYFDINGDVVFAFSDGSELVAGRVYKGYIKDDDFSSYSVGDRFYLEYPSGEFDAYFTYDEQIYPVHFEPIYYELSYKAENVQDTSIDSEVWQVYADTYYRYRPYRQTLRICAHTDPSFAGHKLELDLVWPDNGILSEYECMVDENGDIYVEKDMFYTRIPNLTFSEIAFYE